MSRHCLVITLLLLFCTITGQTSGQTTGQSLSCNGQPCSFTNAVAECIGNQTCQLDYCLPQWGQCPDVDPSQGCLSSLTSISQCGLCTVQCQAIPHGTPACLPIGTVYSNAPLLTVSGSVLTQYSLLSGQAISADLAIGEYLNQPSGPLGDGMLDLSALVVDLWVSVPSADAPHVELSASTGPSFNISIGQAPFDDEEYAVQSVPINATTTWLARQTLAASEENAVLDLVQATLLTSELLLETNVTYWLTLSIGPSAISTGSYTSAAYWAPGTLDLADAQSKNVSTGSLPSPASSLPFGTAFKLQSQDHVCGIGSCKTDWADCNGLYQDGCEADLLSIDTCGSCSNNCSANADYPPAEYFISCEATGLLTQNECAYSSKAVSLNLTPVLLQFNVSALNQLIPGLFNLEVQPYNYTQINALLSSQLAVLLDVPVGAISIVQDTVTETGDPVYWLNIRFVILDLESTTQSQDDATLLSALLSNKTALAIEYQTTPSLISLFVSDALTTVQVESQSNQYCSVHGELQTCSVPSGAWPRVWHKVSTRTDAMSTLLSPFALRLSWSALTAAVLGLYVL